MTIPNSPSQVKKLPGFAGSLPSRALYLYLPPGYEESRNEYPVLYMHDGQNIFDAYVQDCFAGHSWQAARTADRLIAAGEIRPPIIVGIANGDMARTQEYLPDYVTLSKKGGLVFDPPLKGGADRTLAYYINEVAAFIRSKYRVLSGRENTATCGSSMGGLLSNYFAWEAPEFAKHHALLSPAYWLTLNDSGENAMIKRMQALPKPDVRIWIDSGVEDTVGKGDDGMYLTMEMRDAMLALGFEEGVDFHYLLDETAIHHETCWAKRLPGVMRFLFPVEGGYVPEQSAERS